jgi:hypothetical protein
LTFTRPLRFQKAGINAAYQISEAGDGILIAASGSDVTLKRHTATDMMTISWASASHRVRVRHLFLFIFYFFLIFSQSGSERGVALAHGAFMLGAWLVLVPIGVAIARYFKDGEARWFLLHRTLMFAAVLLTIVGVIVIVAYTGTSPYADSSRGTISLSKKRIFVQIWITFLRNLLPFIFVLKNSDFAINYANFAFRNVSWELRDSDWKVGCAGELFDSTHGVVGSVVVVLAVLQPFLAMFRNRARPLWKLQHRATTILVYVGAVVNCFLGNVIDTITLHNFLDSRHKIVQYFAISKSKRILHFPKNCKCGACGASVNDTHVTGAKLLALPMSRTVFTALTGVLVITAVVVLIFLEIKRGRAPAHQQVRLTRIAPTLAKP